jgi:hypothetical protein
MYEKGKKHHSRLVIAKEPKATVAIFFAWRLQKKMQEITTGTACPRNDGFFIAYPLRGNKYYEIIWLQ